RPVLVRMLLGIPPGQVPHVAPAERLRGILILIRLGDGAEELDPLLGVVEAVGVVDDMPHLVPQVAQDVLGVEALDQAHLVGVHRHELGAGQVERNGDRHRLERNSPLAREVEPGTEPPDPHPHQLLQEGLDHRLQPGPLDGEPQVPDRGGPEVGFLEGGLRGGQGCWGHGSRVAGRGLRLRGYGWLWCRASGSGRNGNLAWGGRGDRMGPADEMAGGASGGRRGRRALFLVNPRARTGRSDLEPAEAALRAGGIELVRETTRDLGDSIRRYAVQPDLVILGGGDGPVRSALDAMVELRLPLGILPLGTANNTARTLGIPTDLAEAADVIAAGHTR